MPATCSIENGRAARSKLQQSTNPKKANDVQNLYKNGKDAMNFAEMTIERTRSKHTVAYSPV
ncbi:MAG: hypothetical protein U5N85_10020 [Arcicella sp.]|nr:hypothetical protein [Arcicella sp.]